MTTAQLHIARGYITAVSEFRPPRNHRDRVTFVLDRFPQCSPCDNGNPTRVSYPLSSDTASLFAARVRQCARRVIYEVFFASRNSCKVNPKRQAL